jgi:hypothetical protein
LPRLALAIVGLPLLGLALAQTDYVCRKLTASINTGYGAASAFPLKDRDWIDRALPGTGDVALAPSALAELDTTRRVLWTNEFWNKRVNRSLVLDRYGEVAPFPYQRMTVDPRDGRIRTSGGDEPRFIVFARNQIDFRPRGRLVAEAKTTTIPQDPGLELLDVERPYRASWTATGPSIDGWIVRGKPARVRVFPRRDGRAQLLRLSLNLPNELPAPSRFTVREGAQVVRGKVAGTLQGDAVATLCLAPGRMREATISTRSDRRLRDGRRVGVHLYGIRVQPAGRTC